MRLSISDTLRFVLAGFMLRYMDDIVLDSPVDSRCVEKCGERYVVKIHCVTEKLIKPLRLRSDILEKILDDVRKRDIDFYMKYDEELD